MQPSGSDISESLELGKLEFLGSLAVSSEALTMP